MLGLPPDVWVAVRLTLELATISTAVLLVVGTPIAWWLARTRAWWKEGVAAVVAMPLVLPPTVLGFYLLDVADFDTALDWAGRMPIVRYGTVEVRPVLEGQAWRAPLE